MVLGWTPDGRILFRGQRGPSGLRRRALRRCRPRGGPVERFPLPESGVISFSPDGKRIAFTRIFRDFRTWKRYKGGMAQDVWLYDLASKAIERVTDWVGTDTQPMWIGDAVYFLSDRDGLEAEPLALRPRRRRRRRRVTRFTEYDVKWPHAGHGTDRLRERRRSSSASTRRRPSLAR